VDAVREHPVSQVALDAVQLDDWVARRDLDADLVVLNVVLLDQRAVRDADLDAGAGDAIDQVVLNRYVRVLSDAADANVAVREDLVLADLYAVLLLDPDVHAALQVVVDLAVRDRRVRSLYDHAHSVVLLVALDLHVVEGQP